MEFVVLTRVKVEEDELFLLYDNDFGSSNTICCRLSTVSWRLSIECVRLTVV